MQFDAQKAHPLLHHITAWGFDGVVVSDYFAVDQLQAAHHVSSDKAGSALAAGIVIELPGTDC